MWCWCYRNMIHALSTKASTLSCSKLSIKMYPKTQRSYWKGGIFTDERTHCRIGNDQHIIISHISASEFGQRGGSWDKTWANWLSGLEGTLRVTWSKHPTDVLILSYPCQVISSLWVKELSVLSGTKRILRWCPNHRNSQSERLWCLLPLQTDICLHNTFSEPLDILQKLSNLTIL